MYIGSASCASSTCHGAGEESTKRNVRQNEFNTWYHEDPHSRAFDALKTERGKRIAQNLGFKDAASSDTCLSCHSTNVELSRRGPSFNLSEGISCEGCHGPGSLWLKTHSERNYPSDKLKEQGLYQTSSPIKRSKLCLSCHLGDKEQQITHKIMAAGHPRLVFELATFTETQPRHFDVDNDYIARKSPPSPVKIWALGQIQSAIQTVDLIKDNSGSRDSLFPELAMFDCHTCHHSSKNIRWNKITNDPLTPGQLKLNDSSLMMTKYLLEVIKPDLARELMKSIRLLHKKTSHGEGELTKITNRLSSNLHEAVDLLSVVTLEINSAREILDKLVQAGRKGHLRDVSGAEQAVMSIALITTDLIERDEKYGTNVELNKLIDQLYGVLTDENSFRPDRLQEKMRNLRTSLR